MARTRESGASRKHLEQKQKVAQGFTPGKEGVLGWGQTREERGKHHVYMSRGVREKGQVVVVRTMQMGPWATLQYSCPSVCWQVMVLLIGAEISLSLLTEQRSLKFYPNEHLLLLGLS